jgi:hypothetical protein
MLDTVDRSTGQVHNPQRVLEASVTGAWVHVAQESCLANSAQTLEVRVINHLFFVGSKVN